MIDLLNAITTYYQSQVTPKVRDYLLERGISLKNIEKFRLGYAPPSNSLVKQFSNDIKALEIYGLIKDGRNHFQNRIIFPVISNGSVVFFSGRRFDDKKEYKYIHLPQEIQWLYNEDAIKGKEKILICEGFMDTIIASQLGFNAGGVLGTGLWKDNFLDKVRQTKEILVALDGDDAGRAGTQRIIESLSKIPSVVKKIITLPEGKDINDYFLEHGSDDCKSLLSGGKVYTSQEKPLQIQKGKTVKSNRVKTKQASFLSLSDGRLAEMIFDPNKNPTKQFLVYDLVKDEANEEETVTSSNIPYIPLQSSLIEQKVVLLPSDYAEYGTTAELIQDIKEFIHKYVSLPPLCESISTYYVLLSWVFDNFSVLPYLRVLGEPGCGKSRFLVVIGSVIYKGMFCSGAVTSSPIFRLIEKVGGSFILDEADIKDSDLWAEIIKILNNGYMRGFPVLRSESDGKQWNVKAYEVYSPKLIATRRRFKDAALESRMLTFEMDDAPRKDIPLILPKSFEQEALNLRNKLLLWRFRNYGKINPSSKLNLSGIEPRLQQILIPILSLVDDEQLLIEFETFIRQYQSQIIADRSMESAAAMLQAILTLRQQDTDLTMKNIAEEMNNDIDTEAGENKLSARRVGGINKTYLRLKTHLSSGRYEIEWDTEKIEKLCNRYGITNPFGQEKSDNSIKDKSQAGKSTIEYFQDKYGAKESQEKLLK